jgi:aspartyl/glutamyl-tRNA(Asn/Gln) amidotransferase C subunit
MGEGGADVEIDVSRIAELSKIYFSPEDLRAMRRDMASIIELMDSLRAVELPPEDAAADGAVCLEQLRGDVARESLPQALLTGQAPVGGDFELPRVVE